MRIVQREGCAVTQNRERVIYISYDGDAEPLGQSQVVSYLERLASECDIHLISFEKRGDLREGIRARLAVSGIDWHPLRYYGTPPVASTALDVVRGTHRIRELAAQIEGPLILHARSYVPALMALRARLGERARFLFDIRGFWADERIEGGIWRRRGPLYRLVKRYERRFFAEADAVVTLTEASVQQVRAWMGPNDAPIEVIPTCVDVERFNWQRRVDRPPNAVWAGTVTGWYDFHAGIALAQQIGLPLRVLTRQVAEARAALNQTTAEVTTIPADQVPDELVPGDIGLCTVRPSFSKLASAPTRVGEYLAAGMPVAALAGVGDLDRLLPGAGVGVTLSDASHESIKSAADELLALAGDPETPARCHRLARERFSLEVGAKRYLALYKTMLG